MKTRYLIKHLAGTCLFFAVIFISAGRINYWQGLVYVLTGLVMFTLNYTVLRIDPELSQERSKPGENTKKWDRTILGLSFLATMLMFVIAGLDSGRYHWSPGFHPIVYLSGIILTAAGQLLFLIAQKQNRFFSSTARIQKERGHTVCDTGIYKVIRHPAYLGSIIQSAGFPLIFGSLWSIIPVLGMILLLIIRTNLEDQMLKAELSGYLSYAEKVRFKIIPFVW